MNKTISERIGLIMNEYRLNKNSMSKRIGLTNNVTLGRILNEDRKPSYEVLEKILQTFGSVSPDWLMLGEGDMIRDKASDSKITNNENIGNNSINNIGNTYKYETTESLHKEIDQLHILLKEKDCRIIEKDSLLKEKESQLKEKDSQINQLLTIISKK